MDSRSAIERLAEELGSLYAAAGKPPLSAVARRAVTATSSQRLNTSSISEWLNGKSVPARQQELTLLVQALESWNDSSETLSTRSYRAGKSAHFERLRRAAQSEKREKHSSANSTLSRIPLSAALENPYALEVHKPIVVAGAPAGLPAYIPRTHDATLQSAVLSQKTQLIVLVGGSSTGKTRAAYEALKKLPSGWNFYHPLAPSKAEALISYLEGGGNLGKTVIWLNELQDYLTPTGLGERAAASLRVALSGSSETLFIGTMWPIYWRKIMAPSPSIEDHYGQARALLSGVAHRVDITPDFPASTLEEQARLDGRIRIAADLSGGRITQYLAAGPALLEFFKDSRDISPNAWAVLSAAMDWSAMSGSSTVAPEFLRSAAPGYLTDEEWGAAGEAWFADATDLLGQQLKGATSPLARLRSRKEHAGEYTYKLADYLIQHAQQERKKSPAPESYWRAVGKLDDGPDLSYYIIWAAEDRGKDALAAKLWEPRAECGDPVAIASLLRNPSVDPKMARQLLRQAMDDLDFSNPEEVGFMITQLQEVAHHEEWVGELAEEISKNISSLNTGPSFECAVILDVLEDFDFSHAVSEFSAQLAEEWVDSDSDDSSNTLFLIETLAHANSKQARDSSIVIARKFSASKERSIGDLAFLAAAMRQADSRFSQDILRRIEARASEVDVRDLLKLSPLTENLKSAELTRLAFDLLQKAAVAVEDLVVDSSYAPLEIIQSFQEAGLLDAAERLSARFSLEYDPGISGAAGHTVAKFMEVACPEHYLAYCRRMAVSGPILPLGDSERLVESLREIEGLADIYLRRVEDFLAAERI
ncbi:hypothetical protein [Kitasatospora sp. DSM 101779]|uniref:hypothetical protein n=1 Tax=Kitasatospora sp. DSM 101779 TaxID=2853165 RepID=UPI0021D9A322|nr:hypothetical protein [Kitasatospora sp. DSM 101779]MCU7823870.1 hypothetical protein [Kitasatospora sp. DSM 101779]